MARFPDLGTVFSETGASIPTTYTGNGLGAQFPTGVSSKARYVVTLVTASSSMTTFTVKLQGFDAAAAGPCDFVSTRNDNGVLELEHAFATAGATGTTTYSFDADLRGFLNHRVVGKATGASAAGDSVTITCVAQ